MDSHIELVALVPYTQFALNGELEYERFSSLKSLNGSYEDSDLGINANISPSCFLFPTLDWNLSTSNQVLRKVEKLKNCACITF